MIWACLDSRKTWTSIMESVQSPFSCLIRSLFDHVDGYYMNVLWVCSSCAMIVWFQWNILINITAAGRVESRFDARSPQALSYPGFACVVFFLNPRPTPAQQSFAAEISPHAWIVLATSGATSHEVCYEDKVIGTFISGTSISISRWEHEDLHAGDDHLIRRYQ